MGAVAASERMALACETPCPTRSSRALACSTEELRPSAARLTELRALLVAERIWDWALEMLLNRLLAGIVFWLVLGPLLKLELPRPLLAGEVAVPEPPEKELGT